MLERYSSVSGAKKTIFGRRYGLLDFTFLFLVELGTCVENLILTKVVEGCQKNYFPQRGMLKFTYEGRFWKHALVPLLHVEIFIFEKH
jgi:hypothetical protein